MNLNYQDLITESYEIAKSKGWWEKPRSIAALTLLMQSEVIEALEEFRAGKALNSIWYERTVRDPNDVKYSIVVPEGQEPTDKPCGIPIELADAVIRVADFVGHYKLCLLAVGYDGPKTFEEGLAEANLRFARVYEYALTNKLDQNVGSILDFAVAAIVAVCEHNGIDLERAIQIKQDFNRTRSHRHGGKLI